jgi:ketosteroid isomerase-like protein
MNQYAGDCHNNTKLLSSVSENLFNSHGVSMNYPEWIGNLFATIDRMDETGFCNYLTDDATLIFSNFPPVEGNKDIEAFIGGFFKSIKSLSHKINGYYESGNTVFVQGLVTYTRHNDSQLAVKFCNVYQMEGTMVKNYDIYMDASALYSE